MYTGGCGNVKYIETTGQFTKESSAVFPRGRSYSRTCFTFIFSTFGFTHSQIFSFGFAHIEYICAKPNVCIFLHISIFPHLALNIFRHDLSDVSHLLNVGINTEHRQANSELPPRCATRQPQPREEGKKHRLSHLVISSGSTRSLRLAATAS